MCDGNWWYDVTIVNMLDCYEIPSGSLCVTVSGNGTMLRYDGLWFRRWWPDDDMMDCGLDDGELTMVWWIKFRWVPMMATRTMARLSHDGIMYVTPCIEWLWKSRLCCKMYIEAERDVVELSKVSKKRISEDTLRCDSANLLTCFYLSLRTFATTL